MENKSSWRMFFLVLFIAALGTALRLIFVTMPDKLLSDGLWNDEYVSWSIAAVPFGKHFVDSILFQCHMPFYYLYLKFFIHFFGNTDLMLRLTSVLPGVMSIVSMYFVGKEYKDEANGLLCAVITALSSFLIYFSQEVRFYSLLFFFSSIVLLFTLRLCKGQKKSDIIALAVSSFLVIATHTLGFIFIFLDLVFIGYFLSREEKHKKICFTIVGILFLIIIINLPLIYKVSFFHPYSQWWSSFNLPKIGFLITDYFSPILTNIVSAPDRFFYNPSLEFVVFAILPSVIAIIGIIKALLTKNKEIIGLFYIALSFIGMSIILAVTGKVLFISKYMIEIYPILILLLSFGLLQFQGKWRNFLIFTFCLLNLYYVIYNPNSAPKMRRSEGHKIVAELIKNSQLNKGDFILLDYYPKERFKKYFNFDAYKTFSIDKNTYDKYLGISNKEEFRNIDEKHFENIFNKEILSKMNSGQKLVVVILKDVAIYSPTKMYAILKDKKEYNKAPFFFLVFSQVRNNVFDTCMKNLQIQRLEEKGSWIVVTFVKK